MRYRPEIDGIRAIAVCAVVIFHAGFDVLPGGFIGVDVFFVISGFLISGIVFDDIRSGRFTLTSFFERRARRILPALTVVVLACIPVAWLLLLPRETKDFMQSVATVATFSSNILFWRESGYFEIGAELKPLLHTWSLAIEEQFYLLFPVTILAITRWRDRTKLILLVAGLLGSLSLAEWSAHRFPSAAFYLIPTRAWELMLGILTCVLWRSRMPPFKDGNEFLSITGISMVVCAAFVFDSNTPVPGVWMLLPTIGTTLIILYGREGTVIHRILAHRFLVTVGLMSYSLYLWHQPILAFGRKLGGGDLPLTAKLFICLILVPLSYVSWRLIEQPFRQRDLVSRPQLVSLFVSIGILLVGAGVFGHIDRGNLFRYDAEVVAQAARALVSENQQRKICRIEIGMPIRVPIEGCWYGSGTRKLLTWGDSHNDSISRALAGSLEDVSIYHAAYEGCPPVFGIVRLDRPSDCGEFNRRTLEWALEQNFDAVFLGARWRLYAENIAFDNGEGGVEHFVATFSPEGTFVTDEERFDAIAQSYVTSIEQISSAFYPAPVFLAYQIPEAGAVVPDAYVLATDPDELSTSMTVYDVANQRVSAVFDSIDAPNLVRLYPANLLCDTVIKDRCAWIRNGEILYRDDDHPTMEGAQQIADFYAQTIAPILGLNEANAKY